MEFTHAHALYKRQDDQDPSGMAYNTTVVVFGIFAICLVVTAPMVWMLIWMRNDNNPDHPTRRQPRRRGDLPAAGRPAREERPRDRLPLADRARRAASSLRGRASAAGHAIASRSRKACARLRERLAALSPTSLRRRTAMFKADEHAYDLPIMRKPAWQRLAESGKDVVGGKSGDGGGGGDAKAEDKAGISGPRGGSGSGGGGSEVEVVVDGQEPKAVVAVGMGGVMTA